MEKSKTKATLKHSTLKRAITSSFVKHFFKAFCERTNDYPFSYTKNYYGHEVVYTRIA